MREGIILVKRIMSMTLEQLKTLIFELDDCMDDYLYVYDILDDVYCISPHALERFSIPQSQFQDVLKTHQDFVYHHDLQMLQDDLSQMIDGKKDYHNLQYRWLDKTGKPIWINCRGRIFYNDHHQPHYLIGCINEIGKKQKADNASGLLNEFTLKNVFSHYYTQIHKGFMLRLGIDDFKEINENKGMDYGDIILEETAKCIKKVIHDHQRLYKIVADEFAVVDFESPLDEAIELYHQIRCQLTEFIESRNYESFFTVSGGIVALDNQHDYLEIMRWSEFALNQAKENGKNQYAIFDMNAYNDFQKKRELLKELYQSVNNHMAGFAVYYQPVIDMKDQSIHGVEALLRFQSERFQNVSPIEFIPLLEKSGLIIPVGKWVLDQSAKMYNFVKDQLPDLKIQVNLSYIQVLKSNVLQEMKNVIKNNCLPDGHISVELTESGFIESDRQFMKFCEGLKKNEIMLLLDDFGTGYSNFQYLYNLRPHTIKIDRSMTQKALKNDYEKMLLKHMIEMAHSVHSKICIEGIETKEELQQIMEMQPDYIQGFYFGRPMPLKDFIKISKRFS